MYAMLVIYRGGQPHWNLYGGDIQKSGDRSQPNDGSAFLTYAWAGASRYGGDGTPDSLQKFRREN